MNAWLVAVGLHCVIFFLHCPRLVCIKVHVADCYLVLAVLLKIACTCDAINLSAHDYFEMPPLFKGNNIESHYDSHDFFFPPRN